MRRLRYWLIRKLGGWTPDSPCVIVPPDGEFTAKNVTIGAHGKLPESGAIVFVEPRGG